MTRDKIARKAYDAFEGGTPIGDTGWGDFSTMPKYDEDYSAWLRVAAVLDEEAKPAPGVDDARWKLQRACAAADRVKVAQTAYAKAESELINANRALNDANRDLLGAYAALEARVEPARQTEGG